jgi:hypothetical protein
MSRSTHSRRSFLALAGAAAAPLAAVAACRPRSVKSENETQAILGPDPVELRPADMRLCATNLLTLAAAETVASWVCDNCDDSCEFYTEAFAARANAGFYKRSHEAYGPFGREFDEKERLMEQPLPKPQRVAYTEDDGAVLLVIALAVAVRSLRQSELEHGSRCQGGCLFCCDLAGMQASLEWCAGGCAGTSPRAARASAFLFAPGCDPLSNSRQLSADDIAAIENWPERTRVFVPAKELIAVSIRVARATLA